MGVGEGGGRCGVSTGLWRGGTTDVSPAGVGQCVGVICRGE